MPTYSYTAKNISGETKNDTMEAVDKIEVARTLRKQGFVPIKIEVAGGKSKGGSGGGGFLEKLMHFDVGKHVGFLSSVSLTDKIMFSRHLAVMISAGVPITRAMTVLSKQTKNAKFKAAILQVASDIRKGGNIADSLAKHPSIFDNLYVSMVRSGDATGQITEVLKLLADHLKKDHDLRARIKGAMMYPSIIVIAMVGIGALMMVMVVPNIAGIFEELDAELPPLTRIVIGISNFISSFWYVVLIAIPVILFILKKIFATQAGKRLLSLMFLKMPLFKTLTRKINSARFARTMSSLIEGGVPILQAILITKDTLGNVYYKESMAEIHESVKSGTSLFKSISKFDNIYPGLIVQMVQVGEETGALGEVLIRIAEFYEEEVDNATKNMSTIIEPILMLVIGAVVGLFAVSMIQPMYTLMGNA